MDEPEYCQESGLHVIEQGPTNPTVDIVAVHGLAANPVYTWVKRVSDALIERSEDRVGRLNREGFREVIWLKHLLPAEVPNARILKYNYSSTYLVNAPKETLRSISERLVNNLHKFRIMGQKMTKRPIIFVGHSFGGVVIEEALVYAHHREDFKHIALNTCGVIFLGTPHRGAKVSRWGTTLASFTAFLGLGSHTRILNTLNQNSEVLERLVEDFMVLVRQLRMKLICFYETMPTRVGKFGVFATTLVVDKHSATFDSYPSHSLASDHSGINKFGSSTDENFKLVASAIKKLVEWSHQFLVISETNNAAGSDCLFQLPPPTELFTGRKRDLDIVKEYFGIKDAPKSNSESQKRKVFVLYGLAGSGKTQLALKFAELYTNWFQRIFFVDSSNMKVLNLQLANTARQLKIGGTAKEAMTWLSVCQQNWLLIFDNADDPNLNLRQYFPNGSHGNIIITTRNKDYIAYAPHSNIRMTDFSNAPQDAVDLLLKASMLEPPCDDITRQSVSMLARDLGYLPLAITQAGAYMWQNGITIEEYLDLFKKRRKELLGKPDNSIQNSSDRDRPVYATLDIIYQPLDESAKDFLKICAFLHYERIPKSLFQETIPRFLHAEFESQPDLEAWKSILQAHWTVNGEWDILKFNRTVHQLTSYSLVDVIISDNRCDSFYSLHQLVHFWVHDSLDAESSKTVQEAVKKLVFLSMGRGLTTSDFISRRLFLPHALTIMDIKDLEPDDALLVVQTCYENWELIHAEKLQTQLLQIFHDHFGKADPTVLKSMGLLASIYKMEGRWAEAEELYAEVLGLQRRVVGREHTSTLVTMNNLALVYFDQGRWAEAKKLCVEVLKMRGWILGGEHPDTLSSMHALALAYSHQGQWTEAEKLDMDVLVLYRRIQGMEHRNTSMVMNNLAMVYSCQGQWAESERLHVGVLGMRKGIMGKEHPDTLSSIYGLALVYFD